MDRNFILLKIKKIYKRENFFELLFDKYKLASTRYHAFLTSDKRKLTTDELKIGDEIWVDKTAFLADGSLYKKST
jgi:hypothetical protein